VTSRGFEYGIFILIMVNTLTLAMKVWSVTDLANVLCCKSHICLYTYVLFYKSHTIMSYAHMSSSSWSVGWKPVGVQRSFYHLSPFRSRCFPTVVVITTVGKPLLGNAFSELVFSYWNEYFTTCLLFQTGVFLLWLSCSLDFLVWDCHGFRMHWIMHPEGGIMHICTVLPIIHNNYVCEHMCCVTNRRCLFTNCVVLLITQYVSAHISFLTGITVNIIVVYLSHVSQ